MSFTSFQRTVFCPPPLTKTITLKCPRYIGLLTPPTTADNDFTHIIPGKFTSGMYYFRDLFVKSSNASRARHQWLLDSHTCCQDQFFCVRQSFMRRPPPPSTLRTGFFALSSNVDIGQHSRGIIGMIVVLKLDS